MLGDSMVLWAAEPQLLQLLHPDVGPHHCDATWDSPPLGLQSSDHGRCE